MSIGFQSEEVQLGSLRKRLRLVSDDELVRFGKTARSLCRNRDCPDTFKRQLEEAQAEWRRRNPVAPVAPVTLQTVR
jgi:hypothetical protein